MLTQKQCQVFKSLQRSLYKRFGGEFLDGEVHCNMNLVTTLGFLPKRLHDALDDLHFEIKCWTWMQSSLGSLHGHPCPSTILLARWSTFLQYHLLIMVKQISQYCNESKPLIQTSSSQSMTRCLHRVANFWQELWFSQEHGPGLLSV